MIKPADILLRLSLNDGYSLLLRHDKVILVTNYVSLLTLDLLIEMSMFLGSEHGAYDRVMSSFAMNNRSFRRDQLSSTQILTKRQKKSTHLIVLKNPTKKLGHLVA